VENLGWIAATPDGWKSKQADKIVNASLKVLDLSGGRPLKSADLVRGQYAGYRKEPDVARNSDVETFCALRLFIDSWRWDGVPWYLRSGKYLADTATEILVELKPPPQKLFADSASARGPANYLRFRLSPDSAIAVAARGQGRFDCFGEAEIHQLGPRLG